MYNQFNNVVDGDLPMIRNSDNLREILQEFYRNEIADISTPAGVDLAVAIFRQEVGDASVSPITLEQMGMTCISTTMFTLSLVGRNNVLITSRRSGKRLAWISIEDCDIVDSIREVHDRIGNSMYDILFDDCDLTREFSELRDIWRSRNTMAKNFTRFTRLKDRLMENHLQQFNPDRIRATLNSIRESLVVRIEFEEEIEL